MRPAKLISAALLLASFAGTAAAGNSVKVVTNEQRPNCRFIKFIDIKVSGDKDAALKTALDRAAGYGANGFYVMTNVENVPGKAELSGQALDCKS